ncbi:MAG: FTR1 family protein [Dehalococcoidales bacterium]|nr:FTR1 family protein [Dehalococcoidales bacterium]
MTKPKAINRNLILMVLLSLAAIFLAACVATPQGNGSSWDKPVAEMEDTLNRAVAAYEKGDTVTARQLAKDAYFDVFESSGLETAIRLSISSRRAFEVEYGFTEVNQLIRKEASAAEVKQAVTELMVMIREDASRLGGSAGEGGGSGFLASFLIIVREGFEAILIMGAIIAYLVKSGNGDKVRTIYQSAIAAIVASIATAVAVKYLFNISGASQELLEGATMLLAMVVLFSVSFWLLGKVQAQRWQQYIQSKVQRSLTTGSTLALGSAAFLAVYREGAETVLFYQALAGSAGGNVAGIWLGFAAGALVLVAIFIAIRWGSLKIPIKPFFIGTGVFLYYMAFLFAGEGMRELQAAGSLGTTLIPGMPSIGILGVYPTWEGIILQGALLLTAAGGLAYQFLFKARLAGETGKGDAM